MGNRKTRTDAENAIFGRKPKVSPVTEVKVINVDDIPIPHMIAENEGKLSLWNFICADLANRGVLNVSYVHLLEMLINDIAMYQTLLPELEDEGTTYQTVDKYGNVKHHTNPKFTQVHLLKSSILQKLVSLGMTPKDIVYVVNPAATAQIQAVAEERKKLNYFK
jgi:hypothetical protein